MHKCVVCEGLLHVPCGVTNLNDETLCHNCWGHAKASAPHANTQQAISTIEERAQSGQASAARQAAAVAAASTSPSQAPANTQQAIATIEEQAPAAAAALTVQRPPDVASSAQNQKQKKPPCTTSRKKQKNKEVETRIGVGKRVKIERRNLYHILSTDSQRACLPHGVSADYLYFGTVVSGGGTKTIRKGWDVKFDVLPMEENIIKNITRSKLSVLAPFDEEIATPVIDQADQLEQICGEKDSTSKDKSKNPILRSQKEFKKLDKETKRDATNFEMCWNKKDPKDVINWKIFADNEHYTDRNFSPPTDSILELSNFDLNKTVTENFFEAIFPSIKGHAKVMDKFLSDERAPYYETVKQDRIIFHDEDADDPDWKVKNCYLLLVAAATEVENGVENLWKRGKVGNRRNYPDFGRFVPINEMKAFCSVAPFCWCEEKYWYTPKQDSLWEVFLPCINSFNDQRMRMIKCMMLLLDESMSGWRPKTSKLGGLPNYTYEIRKPVPLGTMFRNSAECISGVLVFQDVVQLPEVQSRKLYYGDKSHLPGNVEIGAHTAEVLRQVRGAQVKPGGWVGGDSWFGSVISAVECMKLFGVYSTWVVKQNNDYFPMLVLHEILKARYGDKPAGHWVVMKAEISGVDVLAIAYAWSHSSCSYFVSTCGSTYPAEQSYTTHFEDEFGIVSTKQISRPHLLEWVYDFLPLIDEHNRQRQNILNLERKWPTKCCWFRLLVTIVGMSVVDLYRIYLNQEKEKYKTITVVEFSDLICREIKERQSRPAPPRNVVCQMFATDNGTEMRIERVTNSAGHVTQRSPTNHQKTKERRLKGRVIGQNCYICRKYLKEDGSTRYNKTAHCCMDCKAPLCLVDRSTSRAGRMSCYMEHKTSSDPDIGCTSICKRNAAFPKSKQVR